VQVKAYCDKNKVGNPFRECEFPLVFNYGIDDMAAAKEWLKTGAGVIVPKKITDRDLNKLVIETWNEIEQDFMPTKRKYE